MKTQPRRDTSAPRSPAGVRLPLALLLGAAAAPVCAVAWTERLTLLLGSVPEAAAVVLGAFALALTLVVVRLRAGCQASGDDGTGRPALGEAAPGDWCCWGGAEIASGIWMAATPWLLGFADHLAARYGAEPSLAAVMRVLLGGIVLLPAALVVVARALVVPGAKAPRAAPNGGPDGPAIALQALGGAIGIAVALTLTPALGFATVMLIVAGSQIAAGGMVLLQVPGGAPRGQRSSMLSAWAPLAAAALSVLLCAGAVLHSDPGERPATASALAGERQRGLLPALLCPRPRQIAVLGLGDGVAVSGIASLGEVERIDCVEPDAAVAAAARLERAANAGVLEERRVRLIPSDARDFIRTTPGSYDLILAQPSHPRMASARGLFTEEYFHACAARLSADGLMAQSLPAGSLNRHDLSRILTAFRRIFPEATLWRTAGARAAGGGGDLLLLGSRDATRVPASRITARVRQNPAIAAAFRRFGWEHPLAFLCLYSLGPGELSAFATGAATLTDDRPLLALLPVMGGREEQGEDLTEALARLRSGDLPTLIAYDRDPRRDARCQYALALGFERLGDYRAAGAAFQEALRLDPHLVPARAHLARLAAKLKQG